MKKYTMPSLQDILMINEREMFGYVMGAYRQKVEENLLQNALFPHIPYTNSTLEECNNFLSEVDSIYANLPQELTGFDLRNKKLLYEKKEYDDVVDIMYTKAVFFKERLFKTSLELDKKYREIASKMRWEPIGLIPTQNICGILFAKYEYDSLVYTYAYTIPTIVPNQKLYRVSLQYIDTWSYSIANNFTSKKMEYLKKIPWYKGNPYCVLVSWTIPLPINRTVLPIIKLELPNILPGNLYHPE